MGDHHPCGVTAMVERSDALSPRVGCGKWGTPLPFLGEQCIKGSFREGLGSHILALILASCPHASVLHVIKLFPHLF